MKHAIATPDTWRKALEAYLSWMRGTHAPDSTIYLRSYHLRRFASELGQPPFPMTLDTLAEYIGRHEHWTASTRRSMRTSIRAFYLWAYITKRIKSNPAEHMPRIRVPIGQPRPAPDAAVDEAKRDHDYRVRLMVQMGAYVGMRCCEIAVAHSRDIFRDLVGWSIVVHGKGGKKRVVELRDELAHVLLQMPEGYFFPGRIQGHLSASYVSKLLSNALPAAVTGHMLRHWFAGKAYKASGNDLRVVQELLGHASVATTQIYTPVDQLGRRMAVNF